MKLRHVLFPLLVSLTASAQDSIVKQYFFRDLMANGYEVVLYTQDHWTDISRSIGCRVYSDTAELRYMEEHFFRRYRKSEGEIQHFCVDDLFFFLKKGEDLVFFKSTNSMCSISDLGKGPTGDCSNIEFLAEHGTQLVADTFSSVPAGVQTKEELRDRFFNNVVLMHEPYDFYDIPKKSARFGPLYYDGYISLSSPFDWNRTPEEMVAAALRDSLGITVDLNDPNINWIAESEFSAPFRFDLYFTKDVTPLYDAVRCRPIGLPKSSYVFEPPIILWRYPGKD